MIVEHRGRDEIPQNHVARRGFALMLFQRRQLERWRLLFASFDARALSPPDIPYPAIIGGPFVVQWNLLHLLRVIGGAALAGRR